MKVFILLTAVVISTPFLSAGQDNKYVSILGTWISEIPVVIRADTGFLEIKFDTLNKMHIKIPHRDNIREEITTDYQVTEDGRFLNTWTHSKQPSKFEIVLLTEAELQLKNTTSSRVEKYRRTKE